jgi:mono/diheme cytochrome c family protein
MVRVLHEVARMKRRALLVLVTTLASGTLAACARPPARAEATSEPKGDPVRGEYLTAIFACQECHTLRQADGMHLDRARLFAGGIPFAGPWGLVHSANVTVPAGSFPDRVLEDAIRGRLAWKFQMPTDLYRGMAADDMRDVVAFIKTLRPVSRPLPENHFEPRYAPPGPLPDVPVPEHAPVPGSPGRGRYLVRVAICQDCHSPRASRGDGEGTGLDAGYDVRHLFGGGGFAFRFQDGRWLIPPNLTPDPFSGIGGWSEADIVKAVRTGITPDGRRLNPMMPYEVAFHVMTDQDAHDIARFLRSLPPIRSGRPRNPRFVASEPPPDCCFVPPPDPAWSHDAGARAKESSR